MAFKKGNSRDDRSTNAGGRPSRGDSSSSAPRGGSDRKTGGRPAGKTPFKSASTSRNTEGGESAGKGTGRKYGEQSDRQFKTGAARKPAFGDRQPKSFGGDAGDRKPFRSTGKPGFRKDGEGSTGADRPFRGGDKPFKGGDRPFRTGEKPFRSTDKPFRAGSKPFGDKPARSGDKPFGDKPFRGGDKPFGDKPARGGDKPYRERTQRSDKPFGDKPFREKPQRDDRPARDDFDADKGANRVMRGRKNGPAKNTGPELLRLNRYISNAGICSRRKADELISAGVISVNGEVVSELGAKVDPSKDIVRYNGETLKREKMVYVLLNKPKDYITTTDDPQERRTVMHLVEKASRERIYPVGRLDRNTTGLLLMTNDGDLADKLSHPRNNITKLYQVELNKALTQGDLNKIQFGLELEDGPIKVDMVSYVAGASKKEIGIQIHSGKNRIVRRIFEHLGYDVVKLDRSTYANLTKKDLPRGRWRFLEEHEVIQLKHLIKIN